MECLHQLPEFGRELVRNEPNIHGLLQLGGKTVRGCHLQVHIDVFEFVVHLESRDQRRHQLLNDTLKELRHDLRLDEFHVDQQIFEVVGRVGSGRPFRDEAVELAVGGDLYFELAGVVVVAVVDLQLGGDVGHGTVHRGRLDQHVHFLVLGEHVVHELLRADLLDLRALQQAGQLLAVPVPRDQLEDQAVVGDLRAQLVRVALLGILMLNQNTVLPSFEKR